MPVPTPRIAQEARLVQPPIAQVQAQGQPGGSATEADPQPPGAERAEGAFGVFGMMISGLIIIFAIVILFLRSRRSR